VAEDFVNLGDFCLEKGDESQALGFFSRAIAANDPQRSGADLYLDPQLESGAEKSRLHDLHEKQFALKREYEAVQRRFEKDYPDYYDLTWWTSTRSYSGAGPGPRRCARPSSARCGATPNTRNRTTGRPSSWSASPAERASGATSRTRAE
jgi:hypothetical protein